MNMTHYLDSANFISGLFELDRTGTVLYSRFRRTNDLLNLTEQLAGQNFFDDVADFENVKDFRNKFMNFVSSRQFSDNFSFNCRLDGKNIPLRVMILRATEANHDETRDILIVDIRRNVY